MRIVTLVAAAATAITITGCRAHVVGVARPLPPTVSPFYDELSPYGTWVYDDVYGWVWAPDPLIVGIDFTPYATGGHWVWSDAGWMWVSYWSWGWAPFHYGRWTFDPYYGWLWVPDTLWAPAWVDWRWGGGYVGWAPLPPSRPGVVVRDHRSYWVFVHAGELGGEQVRVVVPAEASKALEVSVPVRVEVGHDGHSWYSGPDARELPGPARPAPVPVKVKAPPTGTVHRPDGAPPPKVKAVTPPPQQQPRREPRATPAKVPTRAVPGPVRAPAKPAKPTKKK